MRKIILGTVLGLVFSIGAYTSAKAGNGFCEESDPCGGWVKIDASGLAISGGVICTPSVCGDPEQPFFPNDAKCWRRVGAAIHK